MSDKSTKYQKVEPRDRDHLPDRNRSCSEHNVHSDSSDESLPLEAPLARQPRCSIDIDTIEPIVKSAKRDGSSGRGSAYLDISQLNDSIQEISYEYRIIQFLYNLFYVKIEHFQTLACTRSGLPIPDEVNRSSTNSENNVNLTPLRNLKQSITPTIRLRRNSISMPALNNIDIDLNALRQAHGESDSQQPGNVSM